MECPKCGKTMRDGYLFSSKDGAFSFANDVPSMFKNARKVSGFVKITDLQPSKRIRIKASICEDCKKIDFDY